MLKYLSVFVLGAGVALLFVPHRGMVTGLCTHGDTNPCAQVLVELQPHEGGAVTILVDSVLVTFDPPSMMIWAVDDTAQVAVDQYEEVVLR